MTRQFKRIAKIFERKDCYKFELQVGTPGNGEDLEQFLFMKQEDAEEAAYRYLETGKVFQQIFGQTKVIDKDDNQKNNNHSTSCS